MKVSVIIVSWNGKNLLHECLSSLSASNGALPFEVIIIDNASKDGSVAMVREQFSHISCIENTTNRGFAAACNQGIRIARGEYLFFLNPDTRMTIASLEDLVEYMDEHPRVGACGPWIVFPNGATQPSVRRFPTPLSQLLIFFKLHHLAPWLAPLHSYFFQDLDEKVEQEVDQPMGAALMVRRTALDEVGLFDERFFLWFEEVDLCKRIKDAKWSIRYVPQVQVVHHRGVSFRRHSLSERQRMSFTSCAQYLKKHFGFYGTVCSLPMRLYAALLGLFTPSHSESFVARPLVSFGFLFGIALYGISALAFLFPVFEMPLVLLLGGGVFVASLTRLEYGIMAVFGELAVGSFGHLLDIPVSGHTFSLRMVFFGAVLLAWVMVRIKKWRELPLFFRSPHLIPFLFLTIAFGMALTVGILNNNAPVLIFQDANAWLFLLIGLPLFDAVRSLDGVKRLFSFLIGACVAQTLLVLKAVYVFSHRSFGADNILSFYQWIRDSRIGEATQFDNGFTRIFFQSQIVILWLGVFLFLFSLQKKITSRTKKILLGASVCAAGSLLISFSRSFWVAAVALMTAWFFTNLIGREWKRIAKGCVILARSFILGGVLLAAIIFFPLPPSTGSFGADFFSRRLFELQGEAAFKSRWDLLPALIEQIKQVPLFGSGFGTTVTYISSDPRAIALSQGKVTTYAFEWGYLDQLIKFGPIGFFLFIFFLLYVLFQGWRTLKKTHGTLFIKGLLGGFAVLLLVHIFTPYLNHPLGLGILLFTLLSFDRYFQEVADSHG